jgi:hypothetical protein
LALKKPDAQERIVAEPDLSHSGLPFQNGPRCAGAEHPAQERLMFHLMFTTPCLYAIVRFIWPMPWSLPTRLVAALVLLLASQYHLFAKMSSGSVFAPEFPRAVVMLFNWAFGAILLLAVLQILVDLGTLLTMLIRRQWLTIPASLRYAVGTAALVLAAIGVHQAVRVPAVKDIEVAIKDLPPQFDGYRVLQLTDLHISKLFDEPWTRAVVERSNALDVNLIVITGDLIDGPLSARLRDVEPLRDLSAPDGVYVIPGNHEYFFDHDTWMKHFASLGMQRLANSHGDRTRRRPVDPCRRYRPERATRSLARAKSAAGAGRSGGRCADHPARPSAAQRIGGGSSRRSLAVVRPHSRRHDPPARPDHRQRQRRLRFRIL